jgi:L-fuconolactonase
MTPMIDTHHHLWSYKPEAYGWIDESMDVLKRDYLPTDLLSEIHPTGIWGTVVVQARQTLEETRWLLELSEESPFIKGVVGWIDLRAEKMSAQLEEFATNPKLVGLRHVLQDEPDEDFMLHPDFTGGIGQLKAFNLTYDILILHTQVEKACRLVAMFPEQKFVLDHMAKPPIRSGKIHPWKEQMEHLARYPNVWCKISGLVTEADHRRWTYEEMVPYLEVVTKAFGAKRIMVGSDWPVCRLAAEYKEVMGIPRRYFDSFGVEDQMDIFQKNALDCYGLDL